MNMIALQQAKYEREGFTLAADFSLATGTITAVLGPSGAGKSTLLNVIAGFDHLQSGTLLLEGVDHFATHPAARPVNFVFQDNNSFAHLSARDNVALGVSPQLQLSAEDWQRVDQALQNVGLVKLAERKPGAMSGGERQRIALARVQVRQKPVLLLDEAFAALGPSLRREMLELVKSIQSSRNLTVIMVTHHAEDAKLIADQVMFVAKGVVRKPETLSTFFASQDADVVHYHGEQPLLPT